MSTIGGVALNDADVDEATSARKDRDSPRLLLKVWILAMPISSVLLVPSIQGTTPSNLLALVCLLPLLHDRFVQKANPEFYRRLAWLLFALGISIGLSQLALLLSSLSADDVLRVPLASLQPGHYLRRSLISQSAYMATGFIVLSFFWTYYAPSWDRWLFAGAIGLACYGFFEVGWSAATGMSGDFLSNRVFGDGTFSGSLVQFHGYLGVPLMRLKSLTGEPSMYAITLIPYLAFAIFRGRMLVALILAASLFLSVSTTAYLGLALLLPYAALLYARRRRFAVTVEVYLLVLISSVCAFLFAEYIRDYIDATVLRKLDAQDQSGLARQLMHGAAMDLWEKGTIFTQLFGIGFGYVRSTDLFSSLLVNIGAAGLAGWVALYCLPLVRSIGRPRPEQRFAYPLVVLMFLMMLAVPEFSYPTPWAFLGLALMLSARARDGHREGAPAASEAGVDRGEAPRAWV